MPRDNEELATKRGDELNTRQGTKSGPELGKGPEVLGARLEAENLEAKAQTKLRPQFGLEYLDIINKNWVECVPCERKRLSLLGGTLERHLRSKHGFKFGEAVDYCTNELRPQIEARILECYFRPLEHRGGLIKDLSNMKDDLNPSIGGVSKNQLIKLRRRHGRKLWFERWKIVSKALTKEQMSKFVSLAVEKFGSATIGGTIRPKPELYSWADVLEENPNYLMIGQDEELRE